jgi:hypothetical protein
MLNLIRLTVLRSQAFNPSLPISTAESNLDTSLAAGAYLV